MDPPPGSVQCAHGYTAYWYECLKLNPSPVTWDQASIDCEQDHALLPSIHTQAENAVFQVMALRLNQPIWIGLKNKDVRFLESLIYCLDFFLCHFLCHLSSILGGGKIEIVQAPPIFFLLLPLTHRKPYKYFSTFH